MSPTCDFTQPLPVTRTCHICGTETVAKDSCPTCLEAFPSRRRADEMTGDERVAEMRLLEGPLEIDFHLVRRRVKELVGRPVLTLEMGSHGWPMLVEEARTRPDGKS